MVFEDGIRRWGAVFFFVALLELSDAVWRWEARDGDADFRLFADFSLWGMIFFPGLALC